MKFILKINGTESPKAAYVGWTPVKCTLSIDEYSGESPIPVTITTGHDGFEGRISLYNSNATSSKPVDKIEHEFKTNEEINFYVAGKYPHASVAKKDTFIQIESLNEEVPALTKKVMVRVRKNANKLESIEIENFLTAFVKLNNLPPRETYSGDYVAKPSQLLHEIVLMHTFDAMFEIHRRTSFHPWHRAFLLHLERELQAIEPSVTVPYWRFDEGADKVFTSIFIGETEKSDNPTSGPADSRRPKFDRTNPLYSYTDHTIWGGLRRAYSDSNPATGKPLGDIYSEDRILKGPQPSEFPGESPDLFLYWSRFEERNSHNPGHRSFTGHVVDVGKDPVDPLFFMMHSNVDRLWALWQEKYKRFDVNEEKAYPFQGKYAGKRGAEWAEVNADKYDNQRKFYRVDNRDIGNYAGDSLWPWDLDHDLSRPMRQYSENDTGKIDKVPQINIKFPNSITSDYPKNSVTVKSTIDYQDRINAQITLGFDYDVVPYFEHDGKPLDETPMPNAVDHNEIFLNQNLSVAERLEAAGQGFIRKENDQVTALNILRDNNEEEVIRLRSIGLIDLTSESFLDAALEIIANESEPTDLRSKLIHEFIASKRFNLHFPSRKPRFFDLLRGLITSKEQKLRFQAIDILASHEDEVVQEFLVEEIQKDQSEFISKPDAIFFLRQTTKPQHAKLFREVFERSEDPEVKKAAIEGLGNDPDSVELLKKVVQDGTESFKVREASALSLHHLDHETMNDLAAQIIAEPESGAGIKLFRSVSPDPDEVDFKTGLLNLLTFTGDLNRLNQNEGLKSSLTELIDQSPDDKSNFRGSTEALAEISEEEPTMIEQMAAKLLLRLEANDEGE